MVKRIFKLQNTLNKNPETTREAKELYQNVKTVVSATGGLKMMQKITDV